MSKSNIIESVASSTPSIVREAFLKPDAYTPWEMIELEEIGVNVMALDSALSPRTISLVAIHGKYHDELVSAIKTGRKAAFIESTLPLLSVADLKAAAQVFTTRIQATINVFNETGSEDESKK